MNIKNLPQKIYLQVVGDEEIQPNEDYNKIKVNGGITWCEDKMFDNDVCYALQSVTLVEEKEPEAIEFAEWIELSGYHIKGMDDSQRRVIYNKFLNRNEPDEDEYNQVRY